MKYTIDSASIQRHASSLKEAMSVARALLGRNRLYRGAKYITEDGDHAMDIWTSRKAATMEQSVSADVVISWGSN